jgi:hypothetical protein
MVNNYKYAIYGFPSSTGVAKSISFSNCTFQSNNIINTSGINGSAVSIGTLSGGGGTVSNWTFDGGNYGGIYSNLGSNLQTYAIGIAQAGTGTVSNINIIGVNTTGNASGAGSGCSPTSSYGTVVGSLGIICSGTITNMSIGGSL